MGNVASGGVGVGEGRGVVRGREVGVGRAASASRVARGNGVYVGSRAGVGGGAAHAVSARIRLLNRRAVWRAISALSIEHKTAPAKQVHVR